VFLAVVDNAACVLDISYRTISMIRITEGNDQTDRDFRHIAPRIYILPIILNLKMVQEYLGTVSNCKHPLGPTLRHSACTYASLVYDFRHTRQNFAP